MMWGNPVICTYLVLQIPGKPYDNYRISPQSVNITGFPHNIHNPSLWKRAVRITEKPQILQGKPIDTP